ncbi:regulatory protein, Fis family [Devosia sp. YR412]|nr:regulatory protein, Fis family [Devosia sp. YR412]
MSLSNEYGTVDGRPGDIRDQSSAARSGTRQHQLFGRQGEAPAHVMAQRNAVFGRRAETPVAYVSLQRERLRGLFAELWVLFSDPAFPDKGPAMSFDDSEQPAIRLGDSGLIRADGPRGAFVFQRVDDLHLAYTITISDVDQLVDFVVAHLARLDFTPQSGLAQVEAVVGHSLHDVERGLILSTLRHCRGNRTRAAQMLGISLRLLRNKLHSYWAHLLAAEQAAATRHGVNSPENSLAPHDASDRELR